MVTKIKQNELTGGVEGNLHLIGKVMLAVGVTTSIIAIVLAGLVTKQSAVDDWGRMVFHLHSFLFLSEPYSKASPCSLFLRHPLMS